MNRDAALDKLRKLLRIARSSTVGEASTAAAHAQRIMDAHQIEQADADSDDTMGDSSVVLAAAGWHLDLATVLARVNGCCVYWTDERVHVVGRVEDRGVVTYMLSYLVLEIDRLARGDASQAFRFGAVEGIADRLESDRKALCAAARASAPRGANVRGLPARHVVYWLARVERRGTLAAQWMREHIDLEDGGDDAVQRDDAFDRGRIAALRINLGGNTEIGGA